MSLWCIIPHMSGLERDRNRESEPQYAVDLVVLDMAGTTIDDRDEKPLEAFRGAFRASGIEIDPDEARAVMGMSKRDSIEAILLAREGKKPESQRVDEIYSHFPIILEELLGDVKPIVGAEETLKELERMRIKVALSTGYYRKAAEINVQATGWLEEGLVDTWICGDDVERGRPAPDMIFEAMRRLNVENPARVIGVGDTKADVNSHHNAGVIPVAVLTGNDTRETFEGMEKPPDYILESIAGLPDLIKNLGNTDRNSLYP